MTARRAPFERGSARAGWVPLTLFLLATPAWALDIYVDAAAPCGGSPSGGVADPYCSIGAALAAHQGPGVKVHVRPGVYRETVAVPASGSPAAPFILQADGTGVVIDGADDLSDPSRWVRYSGDVWLAAAVTWDPVQVIVDDARLVADTLDAPAALPSGAFRHVTGQGLYMNIGGPVPASHTVRVGRRSAGIVLDGVDWVEVRGFEVTRSDEKGILLEDGSSHCSILSDRATWCGSNGIAVFGCLAITVDGCTTAENRHHGISLRVGTTGSRIHANESFHNAHVSESFANGIYLSESPGNEISANRVHDNEDAGIEIQSGSDDVKSLQNRSWANGDHGFEDLYVTGVSHIGDVAWGNHTDGFSIEGGDSDMVLADCIAVANGVGIGEYDLYVDAGSTVGLASDYNLFWNPAGQDPIKVADTRYATLAAWTAASGLDAHSRSADPRWVDAAHGDFHLLAGSPAIDAGTSMVAGWPPLDAEGHARVDVPGVPNTGAGSPNHADIGALEFVDPSAASVEPTDAGGLSLSRATPNPSRGAVGFTLVTPRGGTLRWSILDMQGRCWRSGASVVTAGPTRLIWDGRGADGRPIPAGLYLLRAVLEGRVATRTLVRLR